MSGCHGDSLTAVFIHEVWLLLCQQENVYLSKCQMLLNSFVRVLSLSHVTCNLVWNWCETGVKWGAKPSTLLHCGYFMMFNKCFSWNFLLFAFLHIFYFILYLLFIILYTTTLYCILYIVYFKFNAKVLYYTTYYIIYIYYYISP